MVKRVFSALAVLLAVATSDAAMAEDAALSLIRVGGDDADAPEAQYLSENLIVKGQALFIGDNACEPTQRRISRWMPYPPKDTRYGDVFAIVDPLDAEGAKLREKPGAFSCPTPQGDTRLELWHGDMQTALVIGAVEDFHLVYEASYSADQLGCAERGLATAGYEQPMAGGGVRSALRLYLKDLVGIPVSDEVPAMNEAVHASLCSGAPIPTGVKFRLPRGTFVYQGMRRASDVASQAPIPGSDKTNIGDIVFGEGTSIWHDGQVCSDLSANLLRGPIMNPRDPIIADTQNHPAAVLPAYQMTVNHGIELYCGDKLFGTMTEVDHQLIVVTSADGSTYHLFERMLTIEQEKRVLDFLRERYGEVKKDEWRETLALYLQERGLPYRFANPVLSEGLLFAINHPQPE